MAKDEFDFVETNGHDYEMDDRLTKEAWSAKQKRAITRTEYYALNGTDLSDVGASKGQSFKEPNSGESWNTKGKS